MSEIYGLIDPRDNKVHYIGQSNKAARRLIEHRNEHGRVNPEKTQWLDDLRAAGLEPILDILETCSEAEVDARELFWIKYGRENGWPLVNKAHGYETTARKIGDVIERAIKLALLPSYALYYSDKAKRLALGVATEQAERELKASYDAIEAARLHAEDLEKFLAQVSEAVYETTLESEA